MTNYDLIQMMPKSKLAETFLEFALKCQAEDEKYFDLGIARYDKIEKWLSQDINVSYEKWAEEYISSLNLSPSIYEALYATGIRTLGDLAKYRAFDLKHIPHIGEKGVSQILEQFEIATGARLKL